MGIYVNPGNISFRRARNSKIYVDKSRIISYTNEHLQTLQSFICVSRPRRFGKSMAADMLAAYYSKGCDSRELFAGLGIEKEESYEKHLNRHNVIRFDVQRLFRSLQSLDTFIPEMERWILEELAEEFPSCKGICLEGNLNRALDQIFAQTGEGFVFIIDEWDCVFRLAKDRKEKQKEYLDFLRGLFKGAEYAELAYMTGILPIKKYGDHSALNIFREFSMLNAGKIADSFGFTEPEVETLCKRHGVDYGKTQEWYDGYLVGERHIYNPQAVVELMENGEFQSYWTGTETYEALKVYIDQDYDGLKQAVGTMLGNGRCALDPSFFQNDMTTFQAKDDVLTLLVHLGYLTYDRKTSEVFIPNKEIAQEFLRAVRAGGWNGLVQALSRSEELLKSTWALDGKAVAEGMEAIHNETASILCYNSENALTCAILIAYYSAKAYYLNPILEMPTGKGFADVVYLPKQGVGYPALLVELKWEKSAESALKQIKEKRYADWIKGYAGEILLVGINYDTKGKRHDCVVERCVVQGDVMS